MTTRKQDNEMDTHENTENVVHLVIPAKPTVLSDGDLDEGGGRAHGRF